MEIKLKALRSSREVWEIDESKVYTATVTELMESYNFGTHKYIKSCPVCSGEGRCGDIEGGTTGESEARYFGGTNFRVCPICEGSGKLLKEIAETKYYRIRQIKEY